VLFACAAVLAGACGGTPTGEGKAAEGNDGAEPGGSARWDFAYFYTDRVNVYGVSADAQSVTPLVSGTVANPVGPIAFDRSYLYYVGAAASGAPDASAILALPVDGSGSAVTIVANANDVSALAVDDTSLYLFGTTYSNGPTGITSYTTSLSKVALDARDVDASALEPLAEEPARGLELAVLGDNVYFSEVVGDSSTPPDARVRRVGTAGGALETLADSPNLTNFAVDASGVYYLDADEPSVDCGPQNPNISYVPADGGAIVQVLAGLPVQGPLAARDGTLYFSTRGKGCTGEPPSDLRKLTSSSGSVETLVSGVTDPADFYLSGQSLYFTYFTDFRAGTQMPSVTSL
jgi:hypothetical protein